MSDKQKVKKKTGKKDLATAQATTARNAKRRALSYAHWQNRKRRRLLAWAAKHKVTLISTMPAKHIRQRVAEVREVTKT